MGSTNADDIAQIPVTYRSKNPLIVQNRAELQAILAEDPEYKRIYDESTAHDLAVAAEADREMAAADAYSKANGRERGDEYFKNYFDKMDKFFEEKRIIQNSFDAKARDRATEIIRQLGHESLLVLDDAGSLGRSTQTHVVLDPSHIRSPDAAFDPSKKDSKDLLASLLAAGVFGAGVAGSTDKEPE